MLCFEGWDTLLIMVKVGIEILLSIHISLLPEPFVTHES